MTYRRIWTGCWGLVVALGVCWAAIVLPVMGGVIVTAVGGVFVALACAAVENPPEGELRVWPSGRTWRRMAWGGPACLALVGVLSASPASALLLLVGAGLSSPPAVARVRAWLGRPAVPPRSPDARPNAGPNAGPQAAPQAATPVAPPEDLPGGPAAPSLAGMRVHGLPDGLVRLPDGVLARLWTESYWALHEGRSTRDRLLIVELRRHVLDELLRRHPAVMTRWLDAGADPHDCPVRSRGDARKARRSPRRDGEETAP